jgi:hypothetical protein
MTAWFFLPQFQGDVEHIAQGQLAMYRSSLAMLEADYGKIAREEFERRRK